MPDAVPPGLLVAQQAALAQVGDDALVGLIRGEAGVALARGLGHAAVEADHRDLLEAVAASDLEVVRVVARRHLERARPHRRVDVLVGDDRHLALDERHDRPLPDEVLVALVGRVDGDRGVAEQRDGTHRRNGHVASADERIVHGVERVVDLEVLDLQVEIAVRQTVHQLIMRLAR